MKSILTCFLTFSEIYSKLIDNFVEIDWKSCALDVKCAAKTLRSYYNAFAQVSGIELI